MTWQGGSFHTYPQPNNGMHPTADTPALIICKHAGRRVMRSVRLPGRYQHSAD